MPGVPLWGHRAELLVGRAVLIMPHQPPSSDGRCHHSRRGTHELGLGQGLTGSTRGRTLSAMVWRRVAASMALQELQVRRIIVAVVLLGSFWLGGCTSGGGVVQVSPGLYSISRKDYTSGFGTFEGTKSSALREAKDFAEKQGKVLVVVSKHEEPGYPMHPASIEYVFRVVAKDDPEALSGSPNVWERFFRANTRAARSHFDSTTSVQIRICAPEQLSEADRSVNAYYAEKHLAPEDAAADDRLEIKRRILDAFRVRDDPSTIVGLGMSSFEGPPQDAHGSDLSEFAKSKGADFVVVVSQYLGEVDGYKVVGVPNLEMASGSATAFGEGTSVTALGSATSIGVSGAVVPTKSSRWKSVAFFYRRVPTEHRAEIDGAPAGKTSE